MHFDVVLDLGIDYGASGGQAWATESIDFPNGRTRRNQNRSAALGVWQLGNRTIDQVQYAYLNGFFHAMRGAAHSFLYKDWNDYSVVQQQLPIAGETAQLIKTYGLDINPWVREIRKPLPATVLIEYQPASVWLPLVADDDYELDAATGIVTWLADIDTGALVRWTGEFWVAARFVQDMLDAQFVGLEGDDRAYDIGSLSVAEESEA